MKLFLTLLFFVNIGHAAVDAAEYEFKPDAGKVEFKTKGWPNLVTIKGEGTGVTGKLIQAEDKVNGELVFNLTTLKTGIDLRDSHMKDKYLEVQQFPTAKLNLSDVSVPKDLDGSFDFKGTLTLHGVEKQVEGKAELDNGDGVITMTAEIPIKLSDFKIAIPSYKGITVAEKVNVNFESTVAQP